jgi:NAD(P)-dependent dehydrogenase (short-subunit alcohol dehydrogenase family)
VVVTGGGTGLGRAIALEFARLGAAVAIWSRGEEHRRAGVVAVEAEGARALGVACDVRDPAAVAAAFDATEAALGLPDVLVNNAAGNFPVPAEDLSPNGFRSVVEIVLHGTFHCAREFGRRHLAAGRPGSILNVGASYAWTGGPGFAHSAAAKAGVKNLTETLAVEWGPYGIRVNGIVPGLVPHEDEVAAIRGVPGREPRDGPGGAGTPRSEAPGGAGEDARAPAGRVGAPREIGWAAVFLASPWAAYVSGHSFVVDGANWQRRAMLQPPFEPIREQLGHGPFSLAPPPAGGRPKP